MLFRRIWWFALLAFVAITLISQQILTTTIPTQAQDVSPSRPSVYPATWTAFQQPNKPEGVTLYHDAYSACKGYETEFEASDGTKYIWKLKGSPELITDANSDVVRGATCPLRRSPDGDEYSPEIIVQCFLEKEGVIDWNATYTGGTNGVCVVSSKYETIKPYLYKILPLFTKEGGCSDKKNSLFICTFRKNYPYLWNAEKNLPYILIEALKDGATDAQLAYMIATAHHESHLGGDMIENGDDSYFKQYADRKTLGNTNKDDHLKYKGRGYSQMTGYGNYSEFTNILKIDLINNPDLANDPSIAAKVLSQGMRDGTFTKKRLDKYVNGKIQDYYNARRVINGILKKKPKTVKVANDIATRANVYAKALGVNK
jgi:hypothetical protein